MSQKLRLLLTRIRLFPLLVVIICLSFLLRAGDFIDGFQNLGAAFAQNEEAPVSDEVMAKDNEEKEEELYQMLDEEKRENRATQQGRLFEKEVEQAPPTMPGIFNDMPDGEPIDWQDASEEDFVNSEVRARLYEDLAARRKELDEREKELVQREALLKAAETQIEQKMEELIALRGEIEALLEEQSEEEKARILSLVKIYEGMKAKDAARIFNTLDMDVLLMVMSEMSERKMAPILAEMNPERARSITILLAQQKQLPSFTSR